LLNLNEDKKERISHSYLYALPAGTGEAASNSHAFAQALKGFK
jgi:hypothetical protein